MHNRPSSYSVAEKNQFKETCQSLLEDARRKRISIKNALINEFGSIDQWKKQCVDFGLNLTISENAKKRFVFLLTDPEDPDFNINVGVSGRVTKQSTTFIAHDFNAPRKRKRSKTVEEELPANSEQMAVGKKRKTDGVPNHHLERQEQVLHPAAGSREKQSTFMMEDGMQCNQQKEKKTEEATVKNGPRIYEFINETNIINLTGDGTGAFLHGKRFPFRLLNPQSVECESSATMSSSVILPSMSSQMVAPDVPKNPLEHQKPVAHPIDGNTMQQDNQVFMRAVPEKQWDFVMEDGMQSDVEGESEDDVLLDFNSLVENSVPPVPTVQTEANVSENPATLFFNVQSNVGDGYMNAKKELIGNLDMYIRQILISRLEASINMGADIGKTWESVKADFNVQCQAFNLDLHILDPETNSPRLVLSEKNTTKILFDKEIDIERLKFLSERSRKQLLANIKDYYQKNEIFKSEIFDMLTQQCQQYQFDFSFININQKTNPELIVNDKKTKEEVFKVVLSDDKKKLLSDLLHLKKGDNESDQHERYQGPANSPYGNRY